MEKKLSDLTTEELVNVIHDSVEVKKGNEPPINRKELMRRLGITMPTVLKLERKGKIPVMRLEGAIRYDWNDVLESLKNGKSMRK